MMSRAGLKQQKRRPTGEVCLSLGKDAEVVRTINRKGMERDRFGIRDKHYWLALLTDP